MPVHASTSAYLTSTTTGASPIYASIRTNARTVSEDLAALRKSVADRTEAHFKMDLDETVPGVTALSYEANDKLKTLDRLAMDAQETLRRLMAALSDDEAMTARLQQAVNNLGDPEVAA